MLSTLQHGCIKLHSLFCGVSPPTGSTSVAKNIFGHLSYNIFGSSFLIGGYYLETYNISSIIIELLNYILCMQELAAIQNDKNEVFYVI